MLHRLRQAQTGQNQLVPPQGWSTTLVKRLQLERTLEGHDGCVNTVHFSPDGQLLVSGSDDMHIFFWDWQQGTRTLAFNSGHHNNVFQARVMPHSANGTVVTCAADGLVRVAYIPQGSGGGAVETRRLACHCGRAHKLALEPDNPHCFLSCGEDGEVRHFDLRQAPSANSRLLACRTQRRRLELNSVHCRAGTSQFCVAGGDPFVRVFDLRRVAPSGSPTAHPLHRLAPRHLRGRLSIITVTCAMFSQQGEVLATYNDENIYLFAEEQQQQAAAAGTRADASDSRAATGGSASVAGAEHGGGTSRGNKRGRTSGSAATAQPLDGLEQEHAEEQADDADARLHRTWQRRGVFSAARSAQAASRAAATAAAAAHARVRRVLMEAEADGQMGDESQPQFELVDVDPAPDGPSGSRQQDADWLDQLPPQEGGSAARHRSWQQGAEQQGKQQRGQDGAEDAELEARGDGEAPGSSNGQQGGREVEDTGLGSEPGLDSSNAMQQAAEASDSGAEMEASSGGEESDSEESDSELDSDGDGSDGYDGSEGEDEFEDEGELPQGALVDDADTLPRAGQRGVSPSDNNEQGQFDDHVLQVYKGHRNYRTVKGVSFLGQDDEFVMSGSDCGHIYVWERESGEVQAVLKGDSDTVNCLEPHPQHLLTMATSGIDSSIKTWSPTAEEPQVLGAAEQRLMARNQAAQGEERRMMISPEMLQMLLRSRRMEARDSSDSGLEGGSSDGDDEEGRRHHADCTIS